MLFLSNNLVFDKTNANQYKYITNDGYKYILQLNKVNNAVKSFKLTIYSGKKAIITTTFKRLGGKKKGK